MATIEITSTYCAETDSYRETEITNNSFDVGAFSDRVNESYAYFPLSKLPAYAIVTSGVLKLRQFQDSDGYYNEEVTMRAAPCTNYVAPGSVTWKNKPKESDSVYKNYPEFSGNTDVDRVWTISGNLNNFRYSGYLIVKVWIPNAAAGDNNAKGFRPSTYDTVNYRPKIILDYYEMPLKVASAQGAINKQTLSMKIAPVQGAINKAVVGMKIAPVQGAISKTVF